MMLMKENLQLHEIFKPEKYIKDDGVHCYSKNYVR